MHLIPIDVSKRQLGKLRKGHPVRVKKGSGVSLVVSPLNYRLATRAFAKNKGLEMKLTPEEIEANRSLTPEQHSQLMKEAKSLDMFKELPFGGAGLFAGASGGDIYDKLADKGIDIGFKLLSKKLGLGVGSGLYAGASGRGLVDELNHQLGTNMGYLKRAGVGKELADKASAEMSDKGFDLKKTVAPIKPYWDDLMAPPSRGTGIRHHRMASMVHPGRRSTGMLVGRGTLHSSDVHLPPALESQPYGANFHMQFQLPPQYHKFNKGGEDIGGSGLYA